MKIDTSTIAGYAEMNDAEKVAALEAFSYDIPEVPDSSEELKKLKGMLSAANSEAANWKRQYREKQTEEERTASERAEAEKALQDELAGLRRDKTISDYKAQYIALGYAPELAAQTAEAMADGQFATVFANQQAFLAAEKTRLEAEAMNRQPGVTGGTVPKSEDLEKEQYAQIARAAGLRI